MSLTNATQFTLMRARKELEKANGHLNWHEVRYWDEQIGRFLSDAFDDPDRDTHALIAELERILSTYSKVVSDLAEASTDAEGFLPDLG